MRRGEEGWAHLYPYPHVLISPPKQRGRGRRRIMERGPLRRGIIVRYTEHAVAPDKEDGAEHARFLRDADPRRLGYDATHAEVDLTVEYLVLVIDIGIVVVVVVVVGVELELWCPFCSGKGRRTGSGSGSGALSGHWPRASTSLLLPCLLCCLRASDDPPFVKRNKRPTVSFLETF